MSAIFIAGTDTGAGKTIVSGLLADYLIGKGKSVVTQKWVSTGSADDIRAHSKITGLASTENRGLIAPYSFKFAASPHLAASLERRPINKKKIEKAFLELCRRYDFVIVEGTGGILVPISRKGLLIGIVKALKIPVILVVHNRLGAINHTLMSIEALRRRKIPIIGLVFNNLSKTNKIILNDNQKIIEEISGVAVLGELPKSDNIKMLKAKFRAIGDKIGL
ncbi:MAG: dethiobiotin synthase [Candidatus Omnitrophota bacterium]